MDLQKKKNEAESKIKQQQNVYEAVRSERNLYSKKLVESEDEIDEMKRKFKIMNHLVQQLKEELNSKDVAFIKEHFDYLKVWWASNPKSNKLKELLKPIIVSKSSVYTWTKHISA